MKARGGRPSAFIAFECLGTLMKHDAGVFLNSFSSAPQEFRKMEIFTIYLQVVGKFVFLEELYCYGDLSFQKGCHQCYHNAVDDYRIKL